MFVWFLQVLSIVLLYYCFVFYYFLLFIPITSITLIRGRIVSCCSDYVADPNASFSNLSLSRPLPTFPLMPIGAERSISIGTSGHLCSSTHHISLSRREHLSAPLYNVFNIWFLNSASWVKRLKSVQRKFTTLAMNFYNL